MKKKGKSMEKDVFTKEMKVVNQNLREWYGIDMAVQKVLECMEEKMSPELMTLLNSALLAFCPDMQLEMAEDLLDFAYGGVMHTTGCMSADAMLAQCYIWIGMEQGIVRQEVVDEYMSNFGL